jgi:hypothetical protein
MAKPEGLGFTVRLVHDRFAVHLGFDRLSGRWECVYATIGRRSGPLRASDLRQIPLGKLIDRALAQDTPKRAAQIEVVSAGKGEAVFRWRGAEEFRMPEGPQPRRPDPPLRLAQAAAVYEEGGQKPIERVAEAFHLSHSGAAKLVGRARQAGYLTKTEKRRVGGHMTAKARRVLEGARE